MRYADAPPGEAPKSDRVMYADISLGGQMLMASDSPEGTGAPQSGVSVMHGTADVPTARRIFEALAEGGSVIAPFGPTFWSQGFGMAKDRYGTHWIVSGPPA
jgi:PhnB protein